MPSRFPVGVVWVCAGLSLSGCALPRCPNKPLERCDPASGYRLANLKAEPGNTDDVFVFLCFSGGGTRAAALSYGVLQGLHATQFPGSEGKRTLLDEVDTVSSVSGGSFTAMAYGLDRERVFDTAYEDNFLKRNIQGRLAQTVTRPVNMLRLPMGFLDRIDLAADYYNSEVFDNRTYADLSRPGTRPYIIINATNMALGERFEFTQDDFDVLGSDLNSMPVGHAVAASSAFPMLLSPLRLRYYPSPDECDVFPAVANDREIHRTNSRRHTWMNSLMPATVDGAEPQYRLDEQNHQYIHLLDGGITDNLGVTALIQELRFGHVREMIESGRIKRLVVVMVDAGTDQPEPIESVANSPGFFLMALFSGKTGVKNYSSAMTRILRFMLREEPARRRQAYERCALAVSENCPDAPSPARPAALDAEYYLIEVNFREIRDLAKRYDFMDMPTSFFLRGRQVDSLISVGAELLAQSPDYQRLVSDLGGTMPALCTKCRRAVAASEPCGRCNRDR